MAVFFASRAENLHDACQKLTSLLPGPNTSPNNHSMWQCEVLSLDLRSALRVINKTEKIAWSSRDRAFAFVGFGTADIVKTHDVDHVSLRDLINKASTLFPDQIYFGAIRFDERSEMSSEWHSFGRKRFILPQVFLSKKNDQYKISLNFRSDGPFSWPVWLDKIKNLLHALQEIAQTFKTSLVLSEKNYTPTELFYSQTVNKALELFTNNGPQKKVVVGRRNSVFIKNSVEASELFLRLKEKSNGTFLFFLELKDGEAFFGASPELLYRRVGRHLKTESLAGTRARSKNEECDVRLREELSSSFKDHREHELVSLHIEEKLKEFGTTDLTTGNLEILALTYVQHLLKRYQGVIDSTIDDAHIIEALHPTPAVCGLDIEWARQFIRLHEGFDRGFYAGPIGYIGINEAEFAVGIRSALFHRQQLDIYAACGIVKGSIQKQEWEELNNKEKSILSIFNHENCHGV